jgi:starvation-inducible DNA-binding protein
VTAEHAPRCAALELQDELRDLLSLAVLGDHVRWVLEGAEGDELEAWLAEASPRWRALADDVAARLATLGVPPDGRIRSLAKDIPMNWVPDGWLSLGEARRLVHDRMLQAAGRARYRQSQAEDSATCQLFERVCADLEQLPGTTDQTS